MRNIMPMRPVWSCRNTVADSDLSTVSELRSNGKAIHDLISVLCRAGPQITTTSPVNDDCSPEASTS